MLSLEEADQNTGSPANITRNCFCLLALFIYGQDKIFRLFLLRNLKVRKLFAMSDEEVSIAALVVALIALIVALGQLFGQYLATADGYRRCQPSVMGRWAKYTRLRWRWSQFRFETLFTTPEISYSAYLTQDAALGSYQDKSRLIRHGYHKHLEFQRTYDEEVTAETVSWLSLLDQLARNLLVTGTTLYVKGFQLPGFSS